MNAHRGGIWQVTDPSGELIDIAGFAVSASDDGRVGAVAEESYDLGDPQRFILDRPGPGREVLIPVAAIEWVNKEAEELRLRVSSEAISAAPPYDPEIDRARAGGASDSHFGQIFAALATRRNA